MQVRKMESVGKLAGGVAHDFNNMLSVILGHAEIALDQIEKNNPVYDDLSEIQTAARRSELLIRQLLAFARRQPAFPKALDLNETVDGMIKMLRSLITENVELMWRPCAGILPVKIDPVQEILANMCINARDAVSGAGKIIIETDSASVDESYCAGHAGFIPGDYIVQSICDDGCGM